MIDRAQRRTVRLALLLMAAGTSPALAFTLSAVPAQPVEAQPFTLAIGYEDACQIVPTGVEAPVFPGIIEVHLKVLCPPSPGLPVPLGSQLLEIPVGPLRAGRWTFRVDLESLQTEIVVQVQQLPLLLDLIPPAPRAGEPVAVRVTLNDACFSVSSADRDGRLISVPLNGNCVLPLPRPLPFTEDVDLGTLPPGDYAVQLTSSEGITLEMRRFRVFGSAECHPSDTALCLRGGRYRVEASWKTGTGSGVAHVRPETADSGSLWFFDEDNLELLVKMLDACSSDDPKVWVFAAGLTNVEVEIAVTDVPAGMTRRYRNPRDTPFAPVLDTAAFDCPTP